MFDTRIAYLKQLCHVEMERAVPQYWEQHNTDIDSTLDDKQYYTCVDNWGNDDCYVEKYPSWRTRMELNAQIEMIDIRFHDVFERFTEHNLYSLY